jgi:hypothetical protein
VVGLKEVLTQLNLFSMTDVDIIKDLLIKESGIDVSKRTREREVIEMRGLFFNVVRTLKPTASLNSMGRCVGVHHSTVLHSMSMFDVYSKYNKDLEKLKEIITKRYILEHRFYAISSIDFEIERLEKQLNLLREHKESLEKDKKDLVV